MGNSDQSDRKNDEAPVGVSDSDRVLAPSGSPAVESGIGGIDTARVHSGSSTTDRIRRPGGRALGVPLAIMASLLIGVAGSVVAVLERRSQGDREQLISMAVQAALEEQRNRMMVEITGAEDEAEVEEKAEAEAEAEIKDEAKEKDKAKAEEKEKEKAAMALEKVKRELFQVAVRRERDIEKRAVDAWRKRLVSEQDSWRWRRDEYAQRLKAVAADRERRKNELARILETTIFTYTRSQKAHYALHDILLCGDEPPDMSRWSQEERDEFRGAIVKENAKRQEIRAEIAAIDAEALNDMPFNEPFPSLDGPPGELWLAQYLVLPDGAIAITRIQPTAMVHFEALGLVRWDEESSGFVLKAEGKQRFVEEMYYSLEVSLEVFELLTVVRDDKLGIVGYVRPEMGAMIARKKAIYKARGMGEEHFKLLEAKKDSVH